jgi:plasmid stabilization system protein ParE
VDYKVLRSAACDRDLSLILDYLAETYQSIGDAPDDAYEQAVARIRTIENHMAALGSDPFQGVLLPDLLPDLHRVTTNRTILYFHVDEAMSVVRILAVFSGAQDHHMRMLLRLAGGTEQPNLPQD